MKEPLSPCQNCENRCLGCHSSCRDYLDFQSAHAEYVKYVRKSKEESWAMDQIEKKRFEKYQKAKIRRKKEGAYN